LFIPGFGDVSTPAALRQTLKANPGTAATAKARSGVLGPYAGAQPGIRSTVTPRDTGTTSSSTGGVSQTFNYPTVLPALTAAQQEALATRRRLATRGFEETEATITREQARANAEAKRNRALIARNQQLQSREGMQTLAGRGVARSPMFTNPFQRQLAERSQREVGELESGLAGTLASLQSALQRSEIERDREYAQIDFDTATARSNIERLLGGF